MSTYNLDFYRTMIDGAERSAAKILPALIESIRPESVLDLGCGVGCWLRVAKALGVKNVHGFDGDYVRKDQLRIAPSEFHPIDLFHSVPGPLRVDLAISLEVAEHLDDARADAIVEYLTSSSDAVFFGAAIPRQGGTAHINEQWQSYWAKKFDARGFRISTEVRDRFWNDADVSVWYRQNALLFVKPGAHPALDPALKRYDSAVLDIVHPDLYTAKMRRYRYLEEGYRLLQEVLNASRSVLLSGRTLRRTEP